MSSAVVAVEPRRIGPHPPLSAAKETVAATVPEDPDYLESLARLHLRRRDYLVTATASHHGGTEDTENGTEEGNSNNTYQG